MGLCAVDVVSVFRYRERNRLSEVRYSWTQLLYEVVLSHASCTCQASGYGDAAKVSLHWQGY